MRWLIVEDALRNRSGHWLEYINTFAHELPFLDNEVDVLIDRKAETFLCERTGFYPVLPESIWARMGDGAGRLTRYARVPKHAIGTAAVMERWLRQNAKPDLVFVPTVLVHHLLGWWRIYQRTLRDSGIRLLLFFPNTPLTLDHDTGKAVLGRDPTARLFGWLIKRFSKAVESGQVILGVETHSMRDAMTMATGVPFRYLPHPVRISKHAKSRRETNHPLHFGCYGSARHEKGSDLLQQAVKLHLREHPESTSRFSIQWLEPFEDHSGNLVHKDAELVTDERVTFIEDYFQDGEYEEQLSKTDVMLLPYRDPYRYRVSRVVIEAMTRGMPVVASEPTTLWEQTSRFGAGLPCGIDDVASLQRAIQSMEVSALELTRQARMKAQAARDHFSVSQFAELVHSQLQSAG